MTSKVPCGQEEGGEICRAGHLCWDCCKILDDRAKADKEEIEKDMDTRFKIVIKSNKELPHCNTLKKNLEEKVQEIIDDGLWMMLGDGHKIHASVSIEEIE